MQLLDGKLISAQLKADLKKEVDLLKSQGGKVPHLAAVLVGNNPASETYVASKVKSCDEVGFASTLIRLPDSITESELLNQIDDLNSNPDIDGFIVQLPLPKQISEKKVLKAIDPDKDVDGFHEVNIGRLALGLPGFVPATPKGIMEMLRYAQVETTGKHCVVLGRSHIVGMPISLLMMQNGNPGNSTVTICHSKTQNLEEITRQADILIAAIGKPNFVKANMVKDGVVVVDVGINRIEDSTRKSGFRLVGDVDFEEVAPKASFITPVPGGVGLMTIACLMLNTLEAVKRKNK
ncbi:MAG: bifunctional methylenetetrahydrofolate dehydrogenase/methenyltetrahydrofolate cyclohydrolase FolD [Bacteroidia bacterium]|nr:bifunctional methylenetetrahydrofolate dehydrogenase/methenyltetrahydrofolate cyclohydrolase FolD [Bacteroidia bacterium]